jgi:hypothetical protein
MDGTSRSLSEAAGHEVESRILNCLHLFPNLQVLGLEAFSSSSSRGMSWEDPSVQYTLHGVVRSICWPRMKRVVLGRTLEVQPQITRNVQPEAQRPPPGAAAAEAVASSVADDAGGIGDDLPLNFLDLLQRAVKLEDFSASRLCIPRAREFFASHRLIETLAALPCLQVLHLGLIGHARPHDGPEISERAMRALAKAPALRTLRLGSFGVDDGLLSCFCRQLLDHRGVSTQLISFEFDDFLPRISINGLLSLWELLQTNHSLVHVEVHCSYELNGDSAEGGGHPALSSLEEEIQALYELNGAGRGAVLADPQRATHRDWLRLLECASCNVGAAFGLLQRCPGLCDNSNNNIHVVSSSCAAVSPAPDPVARGSNRSRDPKKVDDDADLDLKPASVNASKRRRLK